MRRAVGRFLFEYPSSVKMKFRITLWILILQTHSSISKEQHCYQSENTLVQGRSLINSATEFTPSGSSACSIWGNFHFRTFDGKIYRFPGLCNYLLASHCGNPYEDFNIQIHPGLVNNIPAVVQLTIKINYVFIEVVDHVPKIEGQRLQLPYKKNGIFIENSDNFLRIRSTVMLELLWGQDNNIELTLNEKYAGETCGLCGNYNGEPWDDLQYDEDDIDPLLFGQLNKIRRPGEICKDPKPQSSIQCYIYRAKCLNLLTDSKWKKCNTFVSSIPFVESYMMDMCLCKDSEKFSEFCLCSTLAEYSRQCALAGGQPPEWRSPSWCYKTCHDNLIYKECSSPCTPTCSNPGKDTFCDGPCMAKCTCPEGYVLDDITFSGCVHVENCSCIYNNKTYAPGSEFSTRCSKCICSGGHWKCREIPCPSVCSVEGGSHVTTFDKARYMFNGRCTYVLAKPCHNGSFLVTAEMQKCDLSESATCLNRVFLFLNKVLIQFEIKSDNDDFPYITFDEDVMAKANVTICWASSYYLIVYTSLGFYLEVQLLPIMQLYIIIEPAYKGRMCGLCGNFNYNENDDLITSSGILQNDVVDFVNTWKTQFQCQNVVTDYKHPCLYNMEIEKYAQYWCQVLLDIEGPFAPCFSSVYNDEYYQDCLIDTCSFKRVEDHLCAVLSSYAWTCAANGILLSGWRTNVCEHFTKDCPKTFVYSYNVTTCIPTCQSLAKPNSTKSLTFITVDGCVCPDKTYLNHEGLCVKREDCPCYYKELVVPSNEFLLVGQKICNCTNGILLCTLIQIPVCLPPKIYFDCEKAGEYARGAQCPESCDMTKPLCLSPLCVSGCICPKGLLLSHDGSCIKEEQCSCVYNGKYYTSGESAKIQCDTCVCKNRSWECDSKPEKAICTLYGEGHYITFDNKDFTASGNCQYTLVQDFCDNNNLKKGTFKIVTENIPCGTTGASCSVAITVYLGAHKIMFTDGKANVVQRFDGDKISFLIRKMGIYLVLETKIGLVLIWDKMTTIFVHLNIQYKEKVCGLCGNFDGNKENDFLTQNQCLVKDVREFVDSWKISADCPEVYTSKQPCAINPYRMSWAQQMCHIIISNVFEKCHAEVNPLTFYEACVQDTCACDTGGDCNCFCTAIATYAQKCSEACVCVEWRSPTVCPLFCEGYSENYCQWHYKACGLSCLKTCRNPSGICVANLKGLEGCYPKCSRERPYFNEDEMQCVATCGCVDNENYYYKLGDNVESCNSCEKCICTEKGIQCHFLPNGCRCTYQGFEMKTGEVIRLDEDPHKCKIVTCETYGTVISPCYNDENSYIDL